MDMEGTDGRRQMAGVASARATTASPRCACAARAGVLHVRACILWGSAPGGEGHASRPD